MVVNSITYFYDTPNYHEWPQRRVCYFAVVCRSTNQLGLIATYCCDMFNRLIWEHLGGRTNSISKSISITHFEATKHKNRNKLRVYWWKMTSSCHPVIIVYTLTQSLRGISGKSTTKLKWKCDNFNINTPPRRYSISGRMCHYYSTWSIYFGKSASQEATFWSLSHS